MSEYDYGNEPVDPRTLIGLNQQLFDRNLHSYGDPQDEDEGNTELKFMNGVSDQAKQEALIRKLLAEYGIQVPNQPLSEGSANQVPTPGISSPSPIPASSPSLPDPYTMYTNIPSFDQPDFAPHPSPATGMGRTAGQPFTPGYGVGMEMGIEQSVGSQEIAPPTEEKGIWERILECLKEAAQLEIAGVVIYNFYSEVLNGIAGKLLAELFKENATESLDHFSQLTHWMLRVKGGRGFVTAQPNIDEVVNVPFPTDMSVPTYSQELCQIALEKAIQHESKAVETYLRLLGLVKGVDTALENWAMNQVQIETQDLVQFKEWSGEL